MPFDLKDAVDLLSSQQATLYTLWAFYAAACYGAGGFSQFSGGRNDKWIALAVSVGFLVFAAGHLVMVRDALTHIDALTKDIRSQLKYNGAYAHSGFGRSLATLVERDSSLTLPTISHLAIDTCTVAALWVRAISASDKS
jgi:hypothetical protein